MARSGWMALLFDGARGANGLDGNELAAKSFGAPRDEPGKDGISPRDLAAKVIKVLKASFP